MRHLPNWPPIHIFLKMSRRLPPSTTSFIILCLIPSSYPLMFCNLMPNWGIYILCNDTTSTPTYLYPMSCNIDFPHFSFPSSFHIHYDATPTLPSTSFVMWCLLPSSSYILCCMTHSMLQITIGLFSVSSQHCHADVYLPVSNNLYSPIPSKWKYVL